MLLQSPVDAGIREIVDRNAVRRSVPEGSKDAFFGCHGVKQGVWIKIRDSGEHSKTVRIVWNLPVCFSVQSALTRRGTFLRHSVVAQSLRIGH